MRPAGPALLGLVALAGTAAGAEVWPHPVHDRPVLFQFLTELLEYRRTPQGGDGAAWDVFGWAGGDVNRVWVKSEGESEFGERPSGDFDAQLLFGRLVAPYWDVQAGVQLEWSYGPGPNRTRTSLVLGLQGLAPYGFDLEPALFVSRDGDVSARITADYDLLLTQRLILQPRFEAALALQEAEAFGVGRGLSRVEAGLRLRYELRRKFAPYLGIDWRRDVGSTAALTRSEGRDPEELSLLGGVRLWF